MQCMKPLDRQQDVQKCIRHEFSSTYISSWRLWNVWTIWAILCILVNFNYLGTFWSKWLKCPECLKQPRRSVEHVAKRRFSLRPLYDPDRATRVFISCARVGGAHSASSPQAGSSGDEGPYNNIVIFTVFPGYCLISIGILTNFPNSIACHIGITDGVKL